MTNVIEEFNKLRQEGSVRFEELRSLMWSAQLTLMEHYFVSSFISGLKDDMRPMVMMMMPTTVKQATEEARLQELTLEVIFKKHKVVPRTSPFTCHLTRGNSHTAVARLTLGLHRR